MFSTTLRKTDSGRSSVPRASLCTDSLMSLPFLLGREDPRAKTVFVLHILCATWIRHRMCVKRTFGHLVAVVQLPRCMDSVTPWTACSTPGFPVLHCLLEFPQTHHNLLPRVASVHLSAANSSPRVEIVPQSLHSSSQPLCLLGNLCPCPGCIWLWQGLSDSHSI